MDESTVGTLSSQVVDSLTDNDVSRLFCEYTSDVYGHLMPYPIRRTSLQQQRRALWLYVVEFLNDSDEDDERRCLIEGYLRGDVSRKQFVDDIVDDQFMQEPLYRQLNRLVQTT